MPSGILLVNTAHVSGIYLGLATDMHPRPDLENVFLFTCFQARAQGRVIPLRLAAVEAGSEDGARRHVAVVLLPEAPRMDGQ